MGFLDATGVTTLVNKLKQYFLTTNGTAAKTQAVPFGRTDWSTSTDTAFVANVRGITELTDGTAVVLYNGGPASSASGFTVNINGLGAKPVYSSATGAAETTIFTNGYTMLLVYDSSINNTGGWVCYEGQDTDTGSIADRVKTNNSTLIASDTFYRYRILFTSPDGRKWVPANTSTSINSRAVRDVNQRPIDPFGDIVFYNATPYINIGAAVDASRLWQQYPIILGYSFNRTGTDALLTYRAPVYVVATPQADGSAIIDATTPFVQTLPSSKDGKIYIYLGRAFSNSEVELEISHPVYWHDGTGIRLWTGAEPLTLATLPIYDGTVV